MAHMLDVGVLHVRKSRPRSDRADGEHRRPLSEQRCDVSSWTACIRTPCVSPASSRRWELRCS